MSHDVMDFDAMFSEVEAEPYPYKLFGVEGTIPPVIAYGVVMQYQRLAKMEKDSEVPDDFVSNLLVRIFGAETVAAWEDNPKFSTDRMTIVLKWAMQKYGLANTDEDAEVTETKRGKVKA